MELWRRDAVVHTTGGVTCLEALTVGCPIIAYGPPPEHAPALARAMAELEIAAFPKTAAQLQAALLTPKWSFPAGARRTASEELLDVRPRHTQAPKRRLASSVFGVGATAVLAALFLSSRTAFAVIAPALAITPTAQLTTHRGEVALVVEVPPASTTAVIHFLASWHATASFAFRHVPSAPVRELLAKNGDQAIIALSPSGLDDWLGTADTIQDAELGTIALSPTGGVSIGQYLLARIEGAHLIAPSKEL
jgi:hypothetical protein